MYSAPSLVSNNSTAVSRSFVLFWNSCRQTCPSSVKQTTAKTINGNRLVESRFRWSVWWCFPSWHCCWKRGRELSTLCCTSYFNKQNLGKKFLNALYVERSAIACHRNFNAPKICKITISLKVQKRILPKRKVTLVCENTNRENKTNVSDHDGTRTHNLLIRSQTPYPLGHAVLPDTIHFRQ